MNAVSFQRFKKALNKLMKEKSTEVESCSLYIRKCMNQKLVHGRSVSILTLKLLYLRPPDTELCGPFDLTRTSVLVLFCELVPLKA